jgi:peptidoglycan/xylan/chitin deacetylase (PgdA/CDA1 family)
MEFGSHTLNHHLLPNQTSDEARRQLAESKAILEQHTRKPVVALAYPTGAWNPAVAALVPRAGYRVAVGIFSGVEQRAVDRFVLHRMSVGYGAPLQTFVTRLRTLPVSPKRP